MERDYQIETTEMTEEELQAVSGGLGYGWKGNLAVAISYVSMAATIWGIAERNGPT